MNNTVTLPLYQGKMAAGLNYAPKLRNAPGKAARTATLETDGTLTFDQGTVDFSPERQVTPGKAPNFLPPATAQAGSLVDADYTPLVRVTNVGNIVYNATIVAFDVEAAEIEFPTGKVDYSKVIDRAVAISPAPARSPLP